MKAVDPRVRIGAVLNTPPRDYSWGPTWNADVLGECGGIIDFAAVHWYPSTRASEIVALPATEIADMTAALRADFERYGGDRSAPIEIAMTELGGAPGHTLTRDAPQSLALFSADTYLTAIEHGFMNLDWLELHNRTYLVERTQAKGPAYYGIQLASLLANAGDTLVETESNRWQIVVHAAQRADGGYGILLIDQQPPTAPFASVTVELSGAELGPTCERYELSTPELDVPGVLTGPEMVEAPRSAAALELRGFSITLLRCEAAG
jgi:hypothetical protein